MADPLSVTASVIAVVTAGVAISKGLYQIAETMGSAGTDVRWYANDIRLLTTVLDGISDQLNKKPKQSWSKAERVIMDILDVCNGVLGPMNDIQKSLILLLVQFEHSNKKLRQVSARVWWFFKYKDKMVSFRQSLQNLNITLNTQLAAMKLNTAESMSININYHQTSLQLYVVEAEKLLNDRTQRQLGSFDASRAKAITGGSTPTQRPSLPADDDLWAQGNRNPEPEPGVTNVFDVEDEVFRSQDEVFRSQDSTPNVTGMSQALIPYPGQEEELDEAADGLDTEEIIEVERRIFGTLDQTSDGSIQEIWEDLGSALRKVIRYAREVNSAAAQAPPQAVPDEAATRISSTPVHFGDSRAMPSQDAPLGVGRNDSLSSSQLPAYDQFMVFKHLDGKDYLFPYGVVRDWNAAKAAWLSLKFPRLEMPFNEAHRAIWEEQNGTTQRRFWPDRLVITPLYMFEKNLFVLKSPEGYLVPRFWSQTVQPSWTIELQLDDLVGWEGKSRRERVEPKQIERDADRDSKKLTRMFKRDYWR